MHNLYNLYLDTWGTIEEILTNKMMSIIVYLGFDNVESSKMTVWIVNFGNYTFSMLWTHLPELYI